MVTATLPAFPAPTLRPARGGVRIRPIRAADREALAAFYAGLSPDSRYERFHSVSCGIGDEMARRLCGPDHEHGEGFIAERAGPGRTTGPIVGHLCLEPDDDGPEMAVAVADAWQHQGIGHALLDAAVDWGRRHHVDHLRASMLASNGAIARLVAGTGCPVALSSPEAGVVEATIDLAGPRPIRLRRRPRSNPWRMSPARRRW